MKFTARQAVITLALVALLAYAVWPWLPGTRARMRTVVVYGFSIVGQVLNESIFPAFQAHWQRQTGEQVELVSAFAGSGAITNQILLGVPAQVAILATGLDAQKLHKAGLTSEQSLPQDGILNRTPFLILVRPGNPLQIKDFDDLAKPGVRIVHPDPLTSGGAQWAILAEYSSALRTGQDAPAAQHRLQKIWGNVVSQASSAQAARTQFDSGLGDALITYEQDLLRDQKLGKLRGEIVYPPSTVLSEHTVVTLAHNIPKSDQDLVDGLVAFLWSDEAQTIFAEHGFRSVHSRFNQKFTTIANPFTVADLGGWPRAKSEIVDGIWKDQVMPEVGR